MLSFDKNRPDCRWVFTASNIPLSHMPEPEFVIEKSQNKEQKLGIKSPFRLLVKYFGK